MRATGSRRACDGSNVVSARARASDGTPLFATYSAADGYVLEIAQDARAIDARIAGAEQFAIIVVAAAYVLLCVDLAGRLLAGDAQGWY